MNITYKVVIRIGPTQQMLTFESEKLNSDVQTASEVADGMFFTLRDAGWDVKLYRGSTLINNSDWGRV